MRTQVLCLLANMPFHQLFVRDTLCNQSSVAFATMGNVVGRHRRQASDEIHGSRRVVRVICAPSVSLSAGPRSNGFGKASAPVAVVAAAARFSLVIITARMALVTAALPAFGVQPASAAPVGKASAYLAVVAASARVMFLMKLARTALWQTAALPLAGHRSAGKVGSPSAHPELLAVPSSTSSDSSLPAEPTSKNSASSSSSAKRVQAVRTPAAAAAVVKVFRETSSDDASSEERVYVRACMQHFSCINPDDLWAIEGSQWLGKGTFGSCKQLWFSPSPSFSAAAQAAGWPQITTDGVPVVLKRMDRCANSVVDCQREAAVYEDVSSSEYIPRLLNESHGPDCSILVFEGVSHSPQNLQGRVKACAAAVGNQPKHMPLLHILSVARRVSRALRDLHTRFWCHGDMKPANIAMGDDGAYVVDLGVAMKVGAHLWGRLWGSLAYMHPQIEIANNRRRDVVVRLAHDYFSLGLVMVFMLVSGDQGRVEQLREVATRVWCGWDYNSAYREVVELLGEEIKAVVLAHEQQEGLLQPGMAVEVMVGLVELVVRLLLKDVQHGGDVVAIEEMLDQLELMAAGINQQQQQ